jgi:prevent-host-death family protein
VPRADRRRRRQQAEIVITKRGKPVARLVPMEDPGDRERELLARWRGKARQLVDDDELLAPSSELDRWQALDEWPHWQSTRMLLSGGAFSR